MPLFGKKKNDGKKPYPTQQAAYPTQQAAYPQAGAYPAQPPYNPQVAPVHQPQQYSAPPPGAGYAGAPPPYSATAAPPQAQAGYPQASYPQAPVYNPPQAQAAVGGSFDAGARFNSRNPPTIPPPPPGCAPNAAQVAASQGHNVVMGQKPSNWVTGGSDGGYTLW